MKTVLLILGGVLMAHGVWAGISCPTAVAHRRAAASAISNPILFEKAVADGLKDRDPMIRRYALVALNEKNPERAKAAAKGLTADESAAVRKVAKMLCREGGLYRENIARSTDPLYDHVVTVQKKVRVTDGAFSLDAAVPPESWVEINFGKPKEDLYVWLNGTYLGQYDIDNDEGKPFRLDATKETIAPGENVLVVKSADGAARDCRMTVEVMK